MNDIEKIITAIRETSQHLGRLPWETTVERAFDVFANHLEEIQRREDEQTDAETDFSP